MERQRALEAPEGERDEQNAGRGEEEAGIAERRAVGRENATLARRPDQEDDDGGRSDEREVGEERPANASDRAERRSRDAADGIGGEQARRRLYASSGKRSKTAKVAPIQSPPEPIPMSRRAAK